MSTIAILTEDEKLAYDYPPILTAEARALCFAITPELERMLSRLRTSINKVGFLLQYGYFKTCKRFFVINRFRQEDIDYVAKQIGILSSDINFAMYKKKMPMVHQEAILNMLEFKSLDQTNLIWLEDEIQRHIKRLVEPRKLFFTTLQLLHDRNIALPSYHQLTELISKHYLNYEENLLSIIKSNVSTEQQSKLSAVLELDANRQQGLLNQLKIINQSLKPKSIQASVAVFLQLEELFNVVYPLINQLALTPESSDYYAVWVKKAKLSQLKQFTDKSRLYLHLTAFCQHQYYLRQDAFVDIFMKSVQSVKNTVNIRLNKSDRLSRSQRRDAIRHVTKKSRSYGKLLDEIEVITRSAELTDRAKLKAITDLLDIYQQQKTQEQDENFEHFEKSLDRIANDDDFFDMLEQLSIKLQNRVSCILKVLSFNKDCSNKSIISAINHFKEKDAKIDHKAPMGFLNIQERNVVNPDAGKFRISLYKILLYMHIADAIKSGELNLKHSYRYLSIDDYLIDKNDWINNREALLEAAGLTDFSDCSEVMHQLKLLLSDKYDQVNRHFEGQLNPYLSFNKEGKFHITTPALDDKQTEYISELLDQSGQVPIFKILSEVNRATQFTRCFTHHNIKNAKRYSNEDVCMAGIIGLGCNIGVPKMGLISAGINPNTLKNTVNWYFSQKSLDEANKQIILLINKLSLPNVFISDQCARHSSSDGRKVNVAVESLLANFSFKYFGRGKGVSIYTFIDEKQALFHSTVISASEREAAYVIDGLNNNDVIKSDIHSTDTHGYTESIFATTHFMGCTFAPRIKNVAEQCIYAFSSKSTYENKGYQILPSRTIQQKLISKHWEDILRFMVTIKLKHVSASQLFKRLSSYARSNPLYKAIKEFGRIIKSLFILTYIDDMRLRQSIEKQLNRIELSNKFSNAVFYASNSEFKQASPDEQKISVACKVMIQNCIVLWNYLYLSQLLANYNCNDERLEMLGLIKEGSVMSWGHVNLHGEFDFRHHAANDSPFDMGKILSLRLA